MSTPVFDINDHNMTIFRQNLPYLGFYFTPPTKYCNNFFQKIFRFRITISTIFGFRKTSRRIPAVYASPQKNTCSTYPETFPGKNPRLRQISSERLYTAATRPQRQGMETRYWGHR